MFAGTRLSEEASYDLAKHATIEGAVAGRQRVDGVGLLWLGVGVSLCRHTGHNPRDSTRSSSGPGSAVSTRSIACVSWASKCVPSRLAAALAAPGIGTATRGVAAMSKAWSTR